MVKLPNSPEPRSRSSRRLRRRNYRDTSTNSDSRYTSTYGEPKGLLEMENQAKRTVALMEKHSPQSHYNYYVAMDLLRLQYNLNFIVLCENCHGTHGVDEVLAPER